MANVLGLEVNVKNGDHSIFVFWLVQAAEEEAFRVYSTATPSSSQSSRQEQDWRWKTASPWAPLAGWIDQAWEMTEGLLEGKQALQQKGEGSLSTLFPKKQPRRSCWRNLSQPAPPTAC